MSRSFSDYTNVFFWSFKRMDNVNYNFTIIEALFEAKKINGTPSHFNKPIIILMVSIIECILYDFIQRIYQHVHETIPNLEVEAVSDTRSKKLDQLEVLIAHARKNNLLRSVNEDIYNVLDYLRKVRNRIHIHNAQQQLDDDEYKIFTGINLEMACQMLIKVCEVLCHVYPRPNREFVSMVDFPKPWI